MLAGDYHNGPLSIIIPFGVYGFLAWLWLVAASIRALWLNHRHGPESLRKINTLLLAAFLVQLIVFTFVVGALFSELIIFLSLVGLSLSINNGICSPSRKAVERVADNAQSDFGLISPEVVTRRA